jgi:hypothetical protein
MSSDESSHGTRELSALAKILEEDAKSRFPKYPIQAGQALKDDRVASAILSRLRNGQALIAIELLPYNFRTGLLFVYFEFACHVSGCIGSDCCLVILDGRCAVVGLVDPFDKVRPNPVLPPLPEYEDTEPASAQPFAFSGPSATDHLRFTEEDLYPTEVRHRAFLQQIGGVGLGGGGLGGFGETMTQIDTQTVYHHGGWTPGPFHWVENDTKIDEIADDVIA